MMARWPDKIAPNRQTDFLTAHYDFLTTLADIGGVDAPIGKDGISYLPTIGKIARTVGGHGGMDFIMDYRLMYCLKNGLPLDQDVYDAATWSSIMPLSIKSVAEETIRVDIPDFTRNRWRQNKPLEIVDVDPALLPMIEVEKIVEPPKLSVPAGKLEGSG